MTCTRRELLRLAPGSAAGSLFAPRFLAADAAVKAKGLVIGEPTAQKVGAQVVADGGNAFDAIAAGALAAAIASPYQVGIGGYGGCATLAADGGKKIISLDFNTAAPAAATADMFKPGMEHGGAGSNRQGWLAAGVPGVLAGVQLLLDTYGTRKFADIAKPAIQLAREGVVINQALAAALTRCAPYFAKDAASKALYLKGDKPLTVGERFRNPELADMLAMLAERGSAESFYRGDIAARIADAFKKNGGLVTAKDLAVYRAREVKPLILSWGEQQIHTAPLAAGGLTILETLTILQALGWTTMPKGLPRLQTRIEALRLAWRDRLTLLGDPEIAKVPVDRLLSATYARECAGKIEAAVKAGKLLTHAVTPRDQRGTINLSAADSAGNFIALTLTHGDAFGACVTVPGLGLTLGHGMLRFDTDPAHPNAPGPGKRPLHNMCPTIVTRGGKAIVALGARGGRRIPNAVLEVLIEMVVNGRSLTDALAAPRVHTEGATTLELEKTWPAADALDLAKLGYTVKTAASATVSAVAREKGELVAGMR